MALSKKPSRNTIKHNGYEIIQAKQNVEFASTGFSYNAPFKLIDLAAKHDVVHYHSPWPFMDVCHLLGRIKTPSILTYHADPLGNALLQKAYTPLLNTFLNSVDVVASTSPNYMQSSPFLKRFSHKVRVIPNGIDDIESNTNASSPIADIKSKFGDNFFLFVGVLRHYKGIQYLLEAAKETSATIIIAGDGKARSEFQAYKKANDLDNVHFLGTIDEDYKNALLACCRAFVFPSCTRAEAYGLSLVEACRAAKPMISCELGTGTSYVNQKNKTGLVIPPCNTVALAAAINKLNNNVDEAEAFGFFARKHFEINLTLKKMVSGYFKVYEELCQKS